MTNNYRERWEEIWEPKLLGGLDGINKLLLEVKAFGDEVVAIISKEES